MGGIFGYCGSATCREKITDGLLRLEGRKSELSGTAIKSESGITVFKIHGTPSDLKAKIDNIKSEGGTGIAECKTALRARPSAITSAPCAAEGFAVALNGVIENFDELKKHADADFPIVTDEELMLALLIRNGERQPLKLLQNVLNITKGNPTAALINSEEDAIYCRAGEAPLFVGICDGGFAVSSNLYALYPTAKRYFIIENGELLKLTKDRATAFNAELKRIKKPIRALPELRLYESRYGLYDEALCLPIAVKSAIDRCIKNSELCLKYTPSKRSLEKISRIILTGCGASYNAALHGAFSLEQLTDLPCVSYPSGDLRYSSAVFNRSTLLIAVSFSGESSDTVACVKRAQAFGAKTVAVTAAPYSYLALCCDSVIVTSSELIKSEANLRSFICSSLTLELLALSLGKTRKTVSEIYYSVSLKIAEMLPGKVSASVKTTEAISALSHGLLNAERLIFTGLCTDYAISLEAAQRLREATGITALALSVSELENEGAVFTGGSHIIAFISSPEYAPKTLAELRRLRVLGAEITVITTANLEEEIHDFEGLISFPDSLPLFNGLTAAACAYKAIAEAYELLSSENEQKAV